ncbi:electron transport complex subunit RsxC [Candidatus Thiothrix sp. Deng01]|uniref:Ion-translocating oxidoreductase complex subunit C n=1 Tax=Candidatus Thiothrix phosphatis TaxID=3112415 RepID=A0ABU6CRB5_9GAMM|nr:electron transport complex subunit RsxC [Candidatus Thiothrix sp. Deng01]MEB4589381.1 electron transport complex subunit RsxC [Candidatus Thiothrix sp. Deng01]
MIQALRKLWRFHGGLHLDYHKEESTAQPTRRIPLADELVIPLQQHTGYRPTLEVQAGDYVYKGQQLASHTGFMKVPVHASTSGTITAIEERPIPHSSGLTDLCVILKPDGKDDWGAARMQPYPDYAQVDAETLRQRICAAGIVGMGGAVFPAAIKLNVHDNVPIEALLINGAECEPYITCDDLLMQEKADEIIGGIQVMMHIIAAPRCLIGIEDNKPQAIAAMQAAIGKAADPRIQVTPVPTLYPTGSEKQLIQILTGKEVPSGGRPASIGLICHNPATARAIYRAVVLGEPLIDRYLTVAGKGVAAPCNLDVPLGTPIQHIIQQTGGYTDAAKKLVMGGPMMGVSLQTDQIPAVKATNCILVSNEANDGAPPALPCIRCGRCAEACPTSLLPQQLYWYSRSRDFEKTEQYHLFDCIECGCCAYVCPSHIRLVDYYRFAKSEIRALRESRAKADLARQRHEFQLERQERAKREKAEKLAKHKQQAQTSTDDGKKAAIQAALERAQAKKAQAAQSAAGESME